VIVLIMAAYGFLARRTALGWVLIGWCVLSIAKTFRLEPALSLWNMVPGISQTVFARYAQPSWELALVILAAWGVEQLTTTSKSRGAPLLGAALMLVTAVGGGLYYGAQLWPELHESVGLRNWALSSALWATLTSVVCFALIWRAPAFWVGPALATLLVMDSMLMFAIPTMSTPRGGAADMPAINFLRDNLGLQRFYTLGPIQPNYGAYFGIASINHNYLPVSKRWVDWVQTHLDRAADPVVFNGNYARAAGQPTQAQELRRNLPAYESVGVKYVVAPGKDNPFISTDGIGLQEKIVKQVYADGLISIFELPNPKPYFEMVAGSCAVEVQRRTQAAVNCAAPGTLVRRELFFPEWTATVNGKNAKIVDYQGLFQAIDLPQGKSEVRYRYAPPYIDWAWLLMFVGLGVLALPGFLNRIVRGKPQRGA
jgi:hypothetical protein